MSEYLKFLEGKARFAAWLIVLSILLVAIPILLKSDYKLTAKIFGVAVIMTISFALWYWRLQTIRRIKKRARIRLNLNDRFWLNSHIRFYKGLTRSDKLVFEDRVGLFLAEIRITEIGKDIPVKSTCLYVASSAVISFWGLPYWNYGELSEVLVYPENFNLDNSIHSKGIVEGKVHHRGLMDSTMILSLPALTRGFSFDDGKNVGIHEFAHLLDKEDNSIDGVPFMLSEDDRVIWSRLVVREMKKNNSKSNIDSYAFTNNVEFFAVLMELYKEKPKFLEKNHPEIYHQYTQFFSKIG